jgi:HlyD family secretion protein
MSDPGDETQTGPEAPPRARFQPTPEDIALKESKSATRVPSIIVAIVALIVAGLSVFYLLRPEPLLVQGEVDATRLDIAARVDGRVQSIPVERGQNVAKDAVLVRIDNPETLAKHAQMAAAKAVAEAQLANIMVGTRVEVIAAKKAALERAEAAEVLAQKTFDRTATLAGQGNAPQAASIRRPIPCMRFNARSTRPSPPMIRRSTATPGKSGRSPRPMSRRRAPISTRFNPSSTR